MNMDDKDAEIARLKQALENAVENALTACRAAYKKGLEDANLQVRAYEKAINAHCSCGGAGPGDGCVACEIYHDATGTKRSEA
jgi:C4-dicarboxylate-specific signal transduction histidine kinase